MSTKYLAIYSALFAVSLSQIAAAEIINYPDGSQYVGDTHNGVRQGQGQSAALAHTFIRA